MNNIEDVTSLFAAEEAAAQAAKDKAVAEKKRKEAGAKTAMKEITALISKAEVEISKAEKIADEYGLSFDFSLAYGMGGTYYPPRGDDTDEDGDDWYSSNEGWVSSSAQC